MGAHCTIGRTSLFLYSELMMSFIMRFTSAWNSCFSADSRSFLVSSALRPSSLMACAVMVDVCRAKVQAYQLLALGHLRVRLGSRVRNKLLVHLGQIQLVKVEVILVRGAHGGCVR